MSAILPTLCCFCLPSTEARFYTTCGGVPSCLDAIRCVYTCATIGGFIGVYARSGLPCPNSDGINASAVQDAHISVGGRVSFHRVESDHRALLFDSLCTVFGRVGRTWCRPVYCPRCMCHHAAQPSAKPNVSDSNFPSVDIEQTPRRTRFLAHTRVPISKLVGAARRQGAFRRRMDVELGTRHTPRRRTRCHATAPAATFAINRRLTEARARLLREMRSRRSDHPVMSEGLKIVPGGRRIRGASRRVVSV